METDDFEARLPLILAFERADEEQCTKAQIAANAAAERAAAALEAIWDRSRDRSWVHRAWALVVWSAALTEATRVHSSMVENTMSLWALAYPGRCPPPFETPVMMASRAADTALVNTYRC